MRQGVLVAVGGVPLAVGVFTPKGVKDGVVKIGSNVQVGTFVRVGTRVRVGTAVRVGVAVQS